ncbi:hypothetical protein ABE82_27000 (plasmid) [Paenibacillus peoriae]|uniref:hypothetical protein n=1 Tax=Paenibacillus peoriae TaxID=59893 RepID=UPI000721D3B4|nr:hypothetical protein [Paenibacillus peoriae]ALS10054.1 hypothetical protein ABE82_27000 [Paenibacillus peoriae]
MNPSKVMFVVYILVFVLAFSVDLGVYYKGSENAKRSLAKAIDSGITASTDVNSYTMGKTLLEPAELNSNVRRFFISNLKLDNDLNNRIFRDGHLEVRLQYRSDGAPRVVAIYRANIVMVSGKFVGLDETPLEVVKQTPYYAEYK